MGSRPTRIAGIAPLALALALPSFASASCPNAGREPAALTLRQARTAVVCAVNRRRAARELPLLRRQPKLTGAAQRHSNSMDAANYFSHDSLSGASFLDRIRATGYLRGADGWGVGENLRWGTGHLGTPANAARAWMTSPPHRRIMLKRRYRHIGIGVAFGSPLPGIGSRNAAIYTADFGHR